MASLIHFLKSSRSTRYSIKDHLFLGKDPGRGRLGDDHDSGLNIASRKIRMDTTVSDILEGATSVSMRDHRSHSPVWSGLLTRLSTP